MSQDTGHAAPFSAWEREIAVRYLRARRVDGGLALIAVISFVGTTLAVMALIVVMAIMNGFRADLTQLILGFNGHAYVVGASDNDEARRRLVERIETVPFVTQAMPVIESVALAQSDTAAAPAVVRGLTPADLRATPIVTGDGHLKKGSIDSFGRGEDGGDQIIMGARSSSAWRRYLGSVSAQVVAQAQCTVTVVRARSIEE